MDTNTAPSPKARLPILTRRLTIRPLRSDDIDALHIVYAGPEVTRFIPGGVRDRAGTRRRIDDLIDHHQRHGVSKWAVTLSESGRLIGDCGLQFLPGRTELELGFHIARAYRAHGLPPTPHLHVWPGPYTTDASGYWQSSTRTTTRPSACWPSWACSQSDATTFSAVHGFSTKPGVRHMPWWRGVYWICAANRRGSASGAPRRFGCCRDCATPDGSPVMRPGFATKLELIAANAN
jgi:hypothetical protein